MENEMRQNKVQNGDIDPHYPPASQNGPKIIIPTDVGDLLAYTSDDPNIKGIYIMFRPKGCSEQVDVALVEKLDDSDLLTSAVHADPTSDDYTNIFKISTKEISDSF